MSACSPLLRHAPDAPFAHLADGRIVTADEFLGEARALAARLPAARHVINLCEDRYQFALGFAAAILRGQISALPPSRTAGAIRQVAAACPDGYLLTDRDWADAALPVARIPADLGRLPGPRPLIRADQAAAVLFTSGSTGQPAANLKTWGMLSAGAAELARGLGLGDEPAAVLGTVPPQHMFGLEATLLLPLQRGWRIHAGQPLFPEDIRLALLALPEPRWLMTTPLHLKACMAEHLAVPPLAGILSSTMPLPEPLARAVDAQWDAPLHEIYGCTEAGMMALRQPARTASWRWAGDLRIAPAADGRLIASGPRIIGQLPLNDRIELSDEGAFTLHGRLGNIIKIAGKRTSLEALNAALDAIPGVVDGLFFQPEPDLDNHGRLMAFAVAPGLAPAALVDALRQTIDPVFLPRPLLLIDALPRAGAGKPARAALLDLARRHLNLPPGAGHD